MKKKVLSLLLALALCMSLAIPAMAAGMTKTIPTGGFGENEDGSFSGKLIDGWKLSNVTSEDTFYFTEHEKEKTIENVLYCAEGPATLTSLLGMMRPDSNNPEGVYRFSGSFTDKKTLPDDIIHSGLLTHIEPATLGAKEMSEATNSDGTPKAFDYPTGSAYVLEEGVYLLYCDLIAGVSLVVVANPAAPTSSVGADEALAAANKLNGLGLFNGVGNNADGTPNYDLGRAPNRMEAVTLLVRLLGKEAEAKAGNWKTSFTDVDDWAKPYVGYAYANKLTSGTSATTFSGNDTVSAAQYLTFVLRAMGYQDGADFTWDKAWELTDQLGITSGAYGKDAAFTRGDAVFVSANALDHKLKDGSKTLLEAIKEALASTPEVPAVPPEPVPNVGKTFTVSGEGAVYSKELKMDVPKPITLKLEIISAQEAVFTLNFDYDPADVSSFVVQFSVEDTAYYTFWHSNGVSSARAYNSDTEEDIQLEGLTFSDMKEEYGKITWRVKLPGDCAFNFGMVNENDIVVESIVSYG